MFYTLAGADCENFTVVAAVRKSIRKAVCPLAGQTGVWVGREFRDFTAPPSAPVAGDLRAYFVRWEENLKPSKS